MIDIMARVIRAERIRDGGRTLVLLGIIWCATQINEVKQRVGIIEYRLTNRVSTNTTHNGFAQVEHRKEPARHDGD